MTDEQIAELQRERDRAVELLASCRAQSEAHLQARLEAEDANARAQTDAAQDRRDYEWLNESAGESTHLLRTRAEAAEARVKELEADAQRVRKYGEHENATCSMLARKLVDTEARCKELEAHVAQYNNVSWTGLKETVKHERARVKELVLEMENARLRTQERIEWIESIACAAAWDLGTCEVEKENAWDEARYLSGLMDRQVDRYSAKHRRFRRLAKRYLGLRAEIAHVRKYAARGPSARVATRERDQARAELASRTELVRDLWRSVRCCCSSTGYVCQPCQLKPRVEAALASSTPPKPAKSPLEWPLTTGLGYGTPPEEK